MYKVNVYERNEDSQMSLMDDDWRRYPYENDAKKAIVSNMIETLNLMVDISHQQELYTNNFTLHQKAAENGKVYEGIIRLWNIPAGINGEPYFLYEIEWVDEDPVDKYNKMLKDTHGESLTLWIRQAESDCVRDDDEECDGECEGCAYFKAQYYYEGATCGRSEMYDTPEQAYDAANDYMDILYLCAD